MTKKQVWDGNQGRLENVATRLGRDPFHSSGGFHGSNHRVKTRRLISLGNFSENESYAELYLPF